jgi:hypothetical protein
MRALRRVADAVADARAWRFCFIMCLHSNDTTEIAYLRMIFGCQYSKAGGCVMLKKSC